MRQLCDKYNRAIDSIRQLVSYIFSLQKVERGFFKERRKSDLISWGWKGEEVEKQKMKHGQKFEGIIIGLEDMQKKNYYEKDFE